ncbi:DUF3237 domain-containing protein [Comamonadaceae bacterium PP-2]
MPYATHVVPARRRLLRQGGALLLGAGCGLPALAQTPAAASPADGRPTTEFLYEAQVDIADNLALGQGPLGERRMVPITGGQFEGPGLRGRVLAGGADRQLIRTDGVRQLDALYEMQTHDGAILTVRNRVLIDQPAQGARYARSVIELSAPDGPYAWLNRLVIVGTLESLRPQRQAVRIRAYKLV